MGQTADELRQQVDQKRDDASQKIEQIEQQVMQGAQQVQEKVSETANQVKAKMDLRQQVEERPLLALGAAMAGGMILGSLMKGDQDHQTYRAPVNEQRYQPPRQGGMGQSIRSAAKKSGLDDSIENFASAAFARLGDRMREMTERTFPGVMDRADSGSRATSGTAGDAMTHESTRPFGESTRDTTSFTS
jgi:ElaB/YqjD/DUF883 family membrane-anchored ribosome-binding protein